MRLDLKPGQNSANIACTLVVQMMKTWMIMEWQDLDTFFHDATFDRNELNSEAKATGISPIKMVSSRGKLSYGKNKPKRMKGEIGFSNFCELWPKCVVNVNSSGMHKVCVCEYYQNVKLMLLSLPVKIYYKEVICNYATRNYATCLWKLSWKTRYPKLSETLCYK